MNTEELSEQKSKYEIKSETPDIPVCNTPIESDRLLKLFKIFIEIDKTLNKKGGVTNEKYKESNEI